MIVNIIDLIYINGVCIFVSKKRKNINQIKQMNMKTTNLIGLDLEKSQKITGFLNELLANYQIYYQNLRGFHWNVKGKSFFVLHAKFEELYNDSMQKVDEIAERVLTLGGVPLHSYAAYAKVASLKAVENVSEGDQCLKHVLENLSELIKQEREILVFAESFDDEGTQDLLTSYISQQEKLVWMLGSYLNEK